MNLYKSAAPAMCCNVSSPWELRAVHFLSYLQKINIPSLRYCLNGGVSVFWFVFFCLGSLFRMLLYFRKSSAVGLKRNPPQECFLNHTEM